MDEKKEPKMLQTRKKLRSIAETRGVLFIVAVSVLVVTVAVLLIVMGLHGEKAPSTGAGSGATVSSSQGQTAVRKGFPLNFSGGGVLDVKAVHSGMFVLTKDALSFVSTTGAYRTPVVHSYVEPVLKTGGKYALLFDRITGTFQFTTPRKALITKGQSENGQQISTAAVHEKGNFLLAEKGGSYASLLSYYNSKGEVLFSWECAKEYIVSVAIADNRKDLLCAAVSAKNGELFTKLYLLNIKKTETVWETTLSGVAATECAFAGGNDVLVTCGDRRVLVDTKKKQDAETVVSYPAAALLCRSDNTGNTAVVNQKLGTFDVFEITLYNKHNRAVLEAQTDEKPLDVFCSGKRVFILTDTGVYRVRRSGKLSRVCELSETERGLVMVGSDAFHYGKTALNKN